jgi:hypothetical protein
LIVVWDRLHFSPVDKHGLSDEGLIRISDHAIIALIELLIRQCFFSKVLFFESTSEEPSCRTRRRPLRVSAGDRPAHRLL